MEEAIGKEKKINELSALLQAKAAEIRDKELHLKQMEVRASELETALAKKKDDISKLVRLSSISTSRLSKPDIIARLEKAACEGKTIDEEDWKQLTSTIDMEDPTFKAELMERLPRLNESTLHTAYLVKLGMTNQQIEILTDSPHQSAWNRIRKVRAALGMQ